MKVVESILKATIRPYIAADSTNATHKTVIVKKYPDIFGFFQITETELYIRYHCHIAIQIAANPIANPAPKKLKSILILLLYYCIDLFYHIYF
ncbi:MAG: hypothetical protein P1U46_00585 [Patescibacteria group bacterium]|nr:hypothetical protein [Patescibacteria group bacterium]